MDLHIDTDTLMVALPTMIIGMVIIAVIVAIVLVVVKNADNKKPLKAKRVKVLEKPIQQGRIEWYVMECEDGERMKLRNLNADKIIISVGDRGIVKYRGQTIQAFQRVNKSL